MLCGFNIPVKCFFVVFFYSDTGIVTVAQTSLRFKVALFGSFQIPIHSFFAVLPDTFARIVTVTQTCLCFRIAFFGKRNNFVKFHLRKSCYVAVFVNVDMLCAGGFGKTGHKHNFARDGYYEVRAAFIYYIPHLYFKARGTGKFFRVVR